MCDLHRIGAEQRKAKYSLKRRGELGHDRVRSDQVVFLDEDPISGEDLIIRGNRSVADDVANLDRQDLPAGLAGGRRPDEGTIKRRKLNQNPQLQKPNLLSQRHQVYQLHPKLKRSLNMIL